LRIGVLGGSFNPPHTGHIIIASDAFEALDLDRLIVLPASANPLKGHDPGGPTAEQRLEMVRLTFGDDPRFEVSSMEIERGGLSYMVDTLEALKGTNKEAELILLLGMDSLKTLDRWKRPDRIVELATVAVLARGDAGGSVPAGMTLVTTRRVDVSSTEIRERVAAGRSIKGFVAESVERYISAAELYKVPSDALTHGAGDRGNGNA
jgi:nicotinate-nucleotide adenylyltransferase